MAAVPRNRRSRKGRPSPRKMAFWGAAGLFGVYLLFFLVFGRMGLIAHMRLSDEAGRIEQEAAAARQEIATLTAEAHDLVHDPHTIERISRERLGMVRADETVFLFQGDGAEAASAP